jgi:hypothetical protein
LCRKVKDDRWERHSLCTGRRGVAVIDQNLAPGQGGILHQKVAATLLPHTVRPAVVRSFAETEGLVVERASGKKSG